MSEIERKNILDFNDPQILIRDGYQKVEGSKFIFQNLIFPSTQSANIELIHGMPYINSIRLENCVHLIFLDCIFEGELNVNFIHFNFELKNCVVDKLNINDVKCAPHPPFYMKFIASTIRNISIKNCSFTDRFYINPQSRDEPEYVTRIDNLLIQDVVFGHNFKLHNCEVEHCDINNTNFEKNAAFFKSKFLQSDDLIFKSITFKGFMSFSECEFASTLKLEYVTFGGMSHFRDILFKRGLDLDKANIEKEMNFYDTRGLDSEESKKKTSQETYRIIKYNFSKIGNQIEANRFHKLELEKRADYLQKNKKQYFSEWIVFFTHKITSNMGRSWARPLLGIVVIGMLTNGYLNYKFSLDGHLSWESVGHYIDRTFQFMSIITDKKEYRNAHWVLFLSKVLLGYLYYQFVSAVRKDTTQK